MDLFSSNVLTGIVNSLQVGSNSLVNFFFPDELTSVDEEIHFDVEPDVMGLAPFVSPVVEGQVMTELGYTTKTFTPAYIKPKRAFEPGTAFKRMAGEGLTGSMSPANRRRQQVVNHLEADRKQIGNRLDWMASSILRTGAVTISGDKYPTTVVSFGRDAALTITLTSGNKWGDAGVKPLDSLQTWADLMAQKSGSHPIDVVMEVGAWKVFRSDSDVKDRLNLQRKLSQEPSMGQGALNRSGLTLVDTIDNFNIWLYEGFYKDESGTMQRYLPNGTVLMRGDLMGKRFFGAIKDEEAGLQAIPYFSKSWVEKDPPVRLVMTQSAPLLVPYRPNASLAATVL